MGTDSHCPLRPLVVTGEGWEQCSFHPSANHVLAGQGELCSVGNVDVLGCDILPPVVYSIVQNGGLGLYPCQSFMVGREEFACGVCYATTDMKCNM